MEPHAGDTGTLIRSRIEIARILRELQARGEPVTAYLDEGEEERLFIGQIVAVEPDEGYVLAEFGADKGANTALLALGTATLHANDARTHLEFPAIGPHEAQHGGRAVLRFAFPPLLVRLQRREHARIRIPAAVQLRCIADSAGTAPFEARVVDVSPGGVGAIVFDARIHLDPGTHLRRSKIVFPDAAAVLVDLEVRYTRQVVLEDGTAARRAGCRFIGSARDLERLVHAFISTLPD